MAGALGDIAQRSFLALMLSGRPRVGVVSLTPRAFAALNAPYNACPWL